MKQDVYIPVHRIHRNRRCGATSREALMADVSTALTLARKHIGSGSMVSSARLCLADAVALFDAGKLTLAKERALKSIAYSVGICHPDYERAAR
jgi:hypothetical protein